MRSGGGKLMNVNKLIEAAKEIELLNIKRKERNNKWQQLAVDAKNGLSDKEIKRRRDGLDAGIVIDFGNAIEKLIVALHAKEKQ